MNKTLKAWLTLTIVMVLYMTIGYFVLRGVMGSEELSQINISPGGQTCVGDMLCILFFWPIILLGYGLSQPVSW